MFQLILSGLAVMSFFAWLYLIFFRGGFWRADQWLETGGDGPADPPAVFAVIPARDEAQSVATAIRSLLAQDYAGAFSIILVDDGSTDFTADLARAAAADSGRLTVIDGRPLKSGWTGKLWAVAQGLDYAESHLAGAKFVLLTDADIAHDPGHVRDLVAKAEGQGLGLVSVMVRLRCDSFWERALVPAFIFYFQKLYPFPWVNDPARGTAGAAGGCMLVDLEILHRAGGVEAIRDQVIDDCALASVIKKIAPIWLGFSAKARSRRGYDSLGEFWPMVARTAFVQLKFSGLALLGVIAGLFVIYVIPPLALAGGGDFVAVAAGLGAWILMAIAYAPSLKLYGRSPAWALALPAVTALYAAMTLSAALHYWRGQGSAWKGRHYARTFPAGDQG